MRVCYFGIYQSDFSRNRVYIRGLRENGVEVIECQSHKKGVLKYVDLVRQYFKTKPFDVLIVGYPGYTVVWLAKLLTRKPLIFDALCTMYEAQVLSRGIYKKWSLKYIQVIVCDYVSVKLSKVVLVETEAQKNYFKTRFRLSDDKVRVLLTGADDTLFFPEHITKNETFTVLFRGRFLSEAGLSYIIESAKLLEGKHVHYYIIGSGHVEQEVSDALKRFKPTNITICDTHLSTEDLRKEMLRCHVSLGQFARHDRLKHTIPHKAFESLALKLPYITGKAEGHSGFLVDRENCLLVELASAKDLADTILFLKNSPALYESIRETGYTLYNETATPRILGGRLMSIAQGIQ